MSARHQYYVLSKAYDRNHLIEQGEKSGVNWEKHSDEGVNWMRFSHALCKHLDEGKDIELDNSDPKVLQSMLDQYTQLRELHKQTMIPHIRSAMVKLHAERNDANLRPIDLVNEAHEHLNANGGHLWAEKVSTLVNLNSQIKRLTERLGSTNNPAE